MVDLLLDRIKWGDFVYVHGSSFCVKRWELLDFCLSKKVSSPCIYLIG
jgi:hypothetical protein